MRSQCAHTGKAAVGSVVRLGTLRSGAGPEAEDCAQRRRARKMRRRGCSTRHVRYTIYISISFYMCNLRSIHCLHFKVFWIHTSSSLPFIIERLGGRPGRDHGRGDGSDGCARIGGDFGGLCLLWQPRARSQGQEHEVAGRVEAAPYLRTKVTIPHLYTWGRGTRNPLEQFSPLIFHDVGDG